MNQTADPEVLELSDSTPPRMPILLSRSSLVISMVDDHLVSALSNTKLLEAAMPWTQMELAA